jgi:hypothetical protein
VYEGKLQSRGEGCDVSHPRSEYVHKPSVILGGEGFVLTASSRADSVDLPGEMGLEILACGALVSSSIAGCIIFKSTALMNHYRV